jgi:hypothetical protein
MPSWVSENERYHREILGLLKPPVKVLIHDAMLLLLHLTGRQGSHRVVINRIIRLSFQTLWTDHNEIANMLTTSCMVILLFWGQISALNLHFDLFSSLTDVLIIQHPSTDRSHRFWTWKATAYSLKANFNSLKVSIAFLSCLNNTLCRHVVLSCL